MSTEATVFPIFEDVDPCLALSCDQRESHIAICRADRCPHEWTRTSREDRQRRDERDAEEREKAG
jgi:hypothetical protein